MRSDQGLLDGPSFLVTALLSAEWVAACFVKQSTAVSIFKGTLIKFCILPLPLWTSYSHLYFL